MTYYVYDRRTVMDEPLFTVPSNSDFVNKILTSLYDGQIPDWIYITNQPLPKLTFVSHKQSTNRKRKIY